MQRLGPVIDISSADPDAAAATLAERGIDGVVAFRDELLPITAALAQRLNLPGHSPETAERLTNKFRQRQALADAGVAQPRFCHLPAGLSAAALDRAAASISYPAVLKPTQGAASRGVTWVASEAEVADSYRVEVEHVLEEYMPDDPSRDQRFGSYVSVESAVSAGEASHLAVSGRFPLNDAFRENGSFIPAALDGETTTGVLELAAAAIRALGVSDACLHIEIKLTSEGPKIIEVNGRVGGGPPVVLDSISEVNLLRVAAEIALGLPAAIRGARAMQQHRLLVVRQSSCRRDTRTWPAGDNRAGQSRRLWTASACGSRQEHSSSQAEARSVWSSCPVAHSQSTIWLRPLRSSTARSRSTTRRPPDGGLATLACEHTLTRK